MIENELTFGTNENSESESVIMCGDSRVSFSQ